MGTFIDYISYNMFSPDYDSAKSLSGLSVLIFLLKKDIRSFISNNEIQNSFRIGKSKMDNIVLVFSFELKKMLKRITIFSDSK